MSRCAHDWPDELTAEAACTLCGLEYGDFAVPVRRQYPADRVERARRGRWGDRMTIKDRLHRYTVVDPRSGCWVWSGATDCRGYGQLHISRDEVRRPVKAHILMYERYAGRVPRGLTLDHLCRRTECVNPEHLEPVTRAENTLRQLASTGHWNALKTHCKNGHPFDRFNTRYDRDGGRICRTCRAKANAEYRARAYRNGVAV